MKKVVFLFVYIVYNGQSQVPPLTPMEHHVNILSSVFLYNYPWDSALKSSSSNKTKIISFIIEFQNMKMLFYGLS